MATKKIPPEEAAQLKAKALDEISKSCPSAYGLLKLKPGATPSAQQDPIHYFSLSANQPPHTQALQEISEEAFAMLSQVEKKAVYDQYLNAESWFFSALKEATSKELKMEASTWPETWKRAYNSNKMDSETYFYLTQKEIQQVIKLYEKVIQLGEGIRPYVAKLSPFFTKHYYRSLEKLTKTIKAIKTSNSLVNPTPPDLKDSEERRMPAETCASWENFIDVITNHVNHLKEIQRERLSKKPVLDKICEAATRQLLEQSGGLARDPNEVASSLQNLDKFLNEYILLLKKAQRNTANQTKLGAIGILINKLGGISKTINDPTIYTADKLKKVQEIDSLFMQSKKESGLKTLKKGWVGYWGGRFKSTTSIKDVLTKYHNDSEFQNELAKFNVGRKNKP